MKMARAYFLRRKETGTVKLVKVIYVKKNRGKKYQKTRGYETFS